MKNNPWGIGLIIMIIAGFLMFNNFEIPEYFIFEKTGKTQGTITEVDFKNGIKGHPVKIFQYEYKVKDNTYLDVFEPTIGYQDKKLGDKLLIKYSLENPQKNKVIGHYKRKKVVKNN